MRKATLKSKTSKTVKKKSVKKKPVKKTAKKTIKKITKKTTKKKTSKDVPIPFKDSENIPLYLLRTLVDIFYDFQGQRIQTQLRIGASERENSLTKEDLSIYGITTIFENAQNFEKDIEKLIITQLKNHALYTQYFIKIQGIGPLLAVLLLIFQCLFQNFVHSQKL